MMADEEKPPVVAALSAVMEDVTSVGKGGWNEDQRYRFRGIDDVMNAVGPAFRKHGVVCVPVRSEAHYRDVQTSRGKPSRECTVTVTYRFYGPSGDFLEAQAPGESMDSGDKGTPKAMSVAYRSLLLQTLCIPTDEPDPDSQSYERAPEPEPPATVPPIAAAKARAWQALRKLYPDETPDELRSRTERELADLDSSTSIAAAGVTEWTALALRLEARYDGP
jgi:hypothetical protein